MTRYTAEQRADHAFDLRKHDLSPRHQKRAVSELVAYLHGLLNGPRHDQLTISPEIEKSLRIRVNTVCVEFGMDRLPERVPERVPAFEMLGPNA